LAKALKTGYQLRLRVKRGRNIQNKKALVIVQHTYSHFKVAVYAYECDLLSLPGDKNLKWVSFKELDHYPMGKIDRQIANKIVLVRLKYGVE
jgi:adenine-specific DNA glycosylase